MGSKQTICTLGKLSGHIAQCQMDASPTSWPLIGTACVGNIMEPGNFFGMLTKQLASMSKKFLPLLVRARLVKRIFFLRSPEMKNYAFPFSSTNLQSP